MGDGREGEARLEPLVRDDNKWTSERRSIGGGNGARPLDVAMASSPWPVAGVSQCRQSTLGCCHGVLAMARG